MRETDKHRTGIFCWLTPAWLYFGPTADCLSQLEAGRPCRSAHRHPRRPSGDIMVARCGGAILSLSWRQGHITVFHHNSEKGLPSHQGSVPLFDGETGTLRIDAGWRCHHRHSCTGAASAVAPPICGPPRMPRCWRSSAACSGPELDPCWPSGRSAGPEVRVWSPSLESDTRFARKMGAMTGLPVRICASARRRCSSGYPLRPLQGPRRQ